MKCPTAVEGLFRQPFLHVWCQQHRKEFCCYPGGRDVLCILQSDQGVSCSFHYISHVQAVFCLVFARVRFACTNSPNIAKSKPATWGKCAKCFVLCWHIEGIYCVHMNSIWVQHYSWFVLFPASIHCWNNVIYVTLFQHCVAAGLFFEKHNEKSINKQHLTGCVFFVIHSFVLHVSEIVIGVNLLHCSFLLETYIRGEYCQFEYNYAHF